MDFPFPCCVFRLLVFSHLVNNLSSHLNKLPKVVSRPKKSQVAMQLVSAVLFAAPAAAWLSHPFLKSDDSSSWTPPQETNAARMDGPNIVEGWSPRPTTAPKPLFGRMNIEPRLDGYTLGPATCGFIRSNDRMFSKQRSTTRTVTFC